MLGPIVNCKSPSFGVRRPVTTLIHSDYCEIQVLRCNTDVKLTNVDEMG